MAFADVSDVEDRIDFELSEAEQRMVDSRLDDASEMAKHVSGMAWTDRNVPRVVRTIVLNAVTRYINNPDATVTSRAGDETMVFSDLGEQGSFYFTKQETEMLKGFIRRPSFGSITTTPWRSRDPLDETLWVSTNDEGRGDPYPWLSRRDGVMR